MATNFPLNPMVTSSVRGARSSSRKATAASAAAADSDDSFSSALSSEASSAAAGAVAVAGAADDDWSQPDMEKPTVRNDDETSSPWVPSLRTLALVLSLILLGVTVMQLGGALAWYQLLSRVDRPSLQVGTSSRIPVVPCVFPKLLVAPALAATAFHSCVNTSLELNSVVLTDASAPVRSSAFCPDGFSCGNSELDAIVPRTAATLSASLSAGGACLSTTSFCGNIAFCTSLLAVPTSTAASELVSLRSGALPSPQLWAVVVSAMLTGAGILVFVLLGLGLARAWFCRVPGHSVPSGYGREALFYLFAAQLCFLVLPSAITLVATTPSFGLTASVAAAHCFNVEANAMLADSVWYQRLMGGAIVLSLVVAIAGCSLAGALLCMLNRSVASAARAHRRQEMRELLVHSTQPQQAPPCSATPVVVPTLAVAAPAAPLAAVAAPAAALTLPLAAEAGSPIRFTLGNMLGRGASGCVYLARDLETGSLYAVKEITLSAAASDAAAASTTAAAADASDESRLRAVEAEVATLSALPRHPNVIRYLGSQRITRGATVVLHLILEYCAAGALSSLLRKGPPLGDCKAARAYVSDILRGVGHLHRHGIVHRDIKGQNCLVVVQDGVCTVRISDFGTSKPLQSLSEASSSVGTPRYMSPELIAPQGTGTTGATDIWSIGCTAIEIVTGREPFYDLDPHQALYLVGTAARSPLEYLPAAVSDSCRDFVALCVRLDPKDRPTCDQLLAHPWLGQGQ